jgi:hypothetical protein
MRLQTTPFFQDVFFISSQPFDKFLDVVLIKISLDIVLCPFGHGRHTAFAAADYTDLQGWKEIPQLCRKLHLWRASTGRWPLLAIGHRAIGISMNQI